MVIKETQKPLLYERTLGMSVMEGKGFYYPNDAEKYMYLIAPWKQEVVVEA